MIVYFFSAAECKIMYKSIRDAVRYRQKKVSGKSGDSGDDIDIDAQNSRDPDLDSFAFLTPTSSKFPRKTAVLGGAQPSSASELIPGDGIELIQDDDSESNTSVYSYESKSKKTKVDSVENSFAQMTKVLSSFVEKKAAEPIVEQTPPQPGLKFGYIWQNLDNLFQQLPQADVNELNLKFMSLAYDKIKDNSQQI